MSNIFATKKPFSAITVTIERLTSETFEEDDLSGIPDLVEVIKLQSTGPTEAARAIRKKLKYGNVHRQLRALTILDGLIQNAGPRFQRAFADEPLLERLRVCGTSHLTEPEVREKCSELFRQWAAEYRGKPGMERIASLYKELPRRKQVVTQERSKVLKETENPFGDDEEEEAKEAQQATPVASSSQTPTNLGTRPTGRIESFSTVASSSSKEKKNKKASKDAKGRGKKFNLEAEKGQMTLTIAESSIASTNLMNALQSVNREKERISENPTVLERFETAKNLRRRILRYIHYVESEQWLGGLLHANDELVQALMTFEQLDRSIDADSDSDDDIAEQAHLYRMATLNAKGKGAADADAPSDSFAGLTIEPSPPPQPQRPSAPPRPSAQSKPATQLARALQAQRAPPPPDDDDAEDEDENDPFADRNAVTTPKVERGEPRWT